MPFLQRITLVLEVMVVCVAGTNWNVTNTSMQNALASFDGGKFMFSHSPGLYVCDKSMNDKANAVSKNILLSPVMVQILMGSLDDSCVRVFGVHETIFDVTPVYRSTTFTSYGECAVFLFSSSDVYCVGQSDGRRTRLNLPVSSEDGFTLSDVTVYGTYLVVTYVRQNFMSSVAIPVVNALNPVTLELIGISDLFMFVRGRPEFYLRVDSFSNCVYLSQLDCGGRETPDRNCLSDDAYQIFSAPVRLSVKNAFILYISNFIVFATAVFAPAGDGRTNVFVYVSSMDVLRFTASDYAMPHRVYRLAETQSPTLFTSELYEDIKSIGEAVLSVAWWNDTTLVIGAAVESGGVLTQFPKLIVTVDSLALSNVQSLDLLHGMQVPFVHLAGAVLSAGRLQTCLSCRPTSEGRRVSGYFAFGASSLSLRRLLPCAGADTYIDDSSWDVPPIQTCAALANTTELAARVPVFSMKLTCRGTQIDVVLNMAAGARLVFAQVDPYVARFPRRVLLQVRCGNAIAALYDEYECSGGCRARLFDVTFDLSGGVGIESVRNMLPMSTGSGVWYRRLTLSSNPATGAVRSGVLGAGRWQQHELVVPKIHAHQPIYVHVRRNVSLAKLELDMQVGREGVTKVALDALSVTPVLSEQAAQTKGALVTVVYVPSGANLGALELETLTSGDDSVNWRRVHAAIRLETANTRLAQCEYAARLFAVNDTLHQVGELLPVGCALTLPQFTGQTALQVRCHVELPTKLANNESFVGLELRALTCALPETRALSVELIPFMQISECPAFFFLHAETRSCVACARERCPSGFYVKGCLELLHPARPVDCLACPAPPNSLFPNTSTSCDEWVCQDNFFQATASACAPCTSFLNSTCRQPGMRWAPCSRTENERCVPCDVESRPRYAQWTNASQECAWRCRDGFFRNGDMCERCHSLSDLLLLLDGEGDRAAGVFYRFSACTESRQAASVPCSGADFAYSLNGTYQADAVQFGVDCPLKCADNKRLHLVNVVLSDSTGALWEAKKCIECPSRPTFADGSSLPVNAYEMSATCKATCSVAAEFFAGNNSQVCLWCPRAKCRVGSFLSRTDNCSNCKRCASRIPGSNFVSNGGLDDPYSCAEECPPGFFVRDNVCQPHSTAECVQGLEYRIPGTPLTDAMCGACAVCTGARETRPCGAAGNRECESCGYLEDWNSEWSETGCELLCKDGYTKLYTATGHVCRKCWPCPRGSTLPETPSTCDCTPCDASIPAGAFYTEGCTWRCPLYHTVQDGACRYAHHQASNEVYRPVQVSSVLCKYGQRIVQGTDEDSYSLFTCQDCDVPAGIRTQDLNATWAWGAGCEWNCLGNLMKYASQGTYRCAPYYSRRVGAPQGVTVDWSWGDLTALVGSLVVLLIFTLCLLHRFLATSNQDDEVNEALIEKDVQESVKEREV